MHCLVWLDEINKPKTPQDIDSIISAEFPSLENEPKIHDLVSKFMIYGSCGTINSLFPCMKNNKCSKYYPKKKYFRNIY